MDPQMTPKTKRIVEFLREVSDKDNPSDAEREQAWSLLYDVLRQKQVYLMERHAELDDTARKLRAVRDRLDDIDTRLKMSIRSGIVSDKIH